MVWTGRTYSSVLQSEGLPKAWIARRKKRGVSQALEEDGRERTADSDQAEEVERVWPDPGDVQGGEHDDIDVEHVHQQDPNRHTAEKGGRLLGALEEQQQKWDEEMPDHHELAQIPPARGIAPQEIDSLFGNV